MNIAHVRLSDLHFEEWVSVSGLARPVEMFNTGGWVVDSQGCATRRPGDVRGEAS